MDNGAGSGVGVTRKALGPRRRVPAAEPDSIGGGCAVFGRVARIEGQVQADPEPSRRGKQVGLQFQAAIVVAEQADEEPGAAAVPAQGLQGLGTQRQPLQRLSQKRFQGLQPRVLWLRPRREVGAPARFAVGPG